MPRRLKLAPQSSAAVVQPTNWDICALCQEHGGTLMNPASKGYSTLAVNLTCLNELTELPLNINISRLDDDVAL